MPSIRSGARRWSTAWVDSINRNSDALVSLLRLKHADEYTYVHSVAVCALMVALGRQLGLDEAQCREAGMAGMLHDLGKSLMPLEILNKPGRLTAEEYEIVKQHPVRGHELLQASGGVGAGTMDVCLHHHERIDGTGYPGNLKHGDITLLARMGAVCDVYDALTSDRPYKEGWDPADVVSKMASWKGHFDEHVFQAFVRSVGIFPIGSLVRLTSGRLAIVDPPEPRRTDPARGQADLLDARPAYRCRHSCWISVTHRVRIASSRANPPTSGISGISRPTGPTRRC